MTDQEREQLRAAHPGWTIWRAASGTDMATRRTRLSDQQLHDDRLAVTLMADKYEKPLAEQLEAQRAIEIAEQPETATTP